MSGIRVQVEPEVLQWVMQTAIQQNAENETIDKIEHWIAGDITPTFHQLEELARKTNIPVGYFFLKKPPVESCRIVDFRTVDSISVVNPSRNLLDTVDAMSRAQEWMSEYKKNSGAEPCPYVGCIKISDGCAAAAKRIRSELGLEIQWFAEFRNAIAAFRELRKRIAALGILVMMNGVVGNNTHRKLSTNEFRAFTLIDQYAPLIFINTTDSENGKLFSLLHELVHVMLGKASFYNDEYGSLTYSNKEEQFCNAVAADLLVPEEIFITEWKQHHGTTAEIVEALEQLFVCSAFVLLRKALDCSLIATEEYNRYVKLYEKRYQDHRDGMPANSGGNYYNTMKSRWDPNFVQALGSSVASGRTQYREAYYLTNTTGKTFAALAETTGEYDIG